MIDIQLILLAIGSLLLAGVLLSKLSSYIGVPTLIVFFIAWTFFSMEILFLLLLLIAIHIFSILVYLH
ncbi:hypothetical protein [Methanobrevibacter arboriphilus]|uniref:hypothetical protein n=1 Tax=Methanobrevibacter arboriphilus TaxID=39441 RepID=UPI000B25B2D9|nr:hypothetical protein [Methanobrevibacter arboriphilus]